MNRTRIAWTDFTWTVSRGCKPVSPGCVHCYAARFATRFSGKDGLYGGLAKGGKWTGNVRLVRENLHEPLRRRIPTKIFVDSMSDLFHEMVPDEFLDDVFGAMWACLYLGPGAYPGHVFQLLTKRPKRALEYLSSDRIERWARAAGNMCEDADGIYDQTYSAASKGPHPRIWLGVTAENQAMANERIPILINIPSALHFVSVEPMLEAVNLCAVPDDKTRPAEFSAKYTPLGDLGWVICGCESGHGARPFESGWAEYLRDQCIGAGVPFFLKQARDRNGNFIEMPAIDGKVWDQIPEVK